MRGSLQHFYVSRIGLSGLSEGGSKILRRCNVSPGVHGDRRMSRSTMTSARNGSRLTTECELRACISTFLHCPIPHRNVLLSWALKMNHVLLKVQKITSLNYRFDPPPDPLRWDTASDFVGPDLTLKRPLHLACGTFLLQRYSWAVSSEPNHRSRSGPMITR